MNLSDAAHRYREKRSRHPPPGFDKWYAYAKARDALVPETFFDQIYHDLGPFWGMPVNDVRRSVRGFSPKITVRGGVVDSDAKGSYERVSGLMGMLEELNKEGVEVPDVDLPLNVNEEIAMLVPWETMETAVEFARTFMPPLQDVVGAFSALEDNGMEEGIFDPEWLDNRMYHKVGGPYLGPRPLWSLVQPACPPKSATAKGELMVDIWHQGHTKGAHTVAALLPLELPANSSEGYVANWTMASDVCERPELQGLYGSFFAPKSMSVTQKLFPLFSASKISGSNEILIPTFSSFNASTTASRLPWNEMEMELHWRGPASGGAASRLSWRRMHRHRFASMLNATHVEIAEAMLHAGNETTVGLGYAGNFRLLPANAYHLDTQKGGRMAEWVSGWADVGFTDLQCDEPGDNGTCPYSNEYFSVKEQPGDVKGQYKYTAVLDGDTGDDGGELVQRLVEGRVVLRASVYKQWVDARLVPWTHFVPLDNTLVDLYGIMEYFLGTAVPSSPPTFAHAHVEVEKHEHHFQTPHWDEEVEDVDGGGEAHEEHGRSVDVNEAQSDSGNGHDAQAQRIAEAGQQWAHQVLRRDDVLIYTYRLLLEYARVVDAKRHTMGWVGDLFVEGP
ncbi:hypothetical protein SLS60_000523 [Paraconiothyrium brasiliense]|uniref:Glycosyl transferase CAP10 domain-containing protein n=1 Tax=Paraconiothyrium brasiliense TaxID=300254 RepID=A0ABR3S7M4_9PLEO